MLSLQSVRAWGCRLIRRIAWSVIAALGVSATVAASPVQVSVCGTDDAPGGTNLSQALIQGGEIEIRCPSGQDSIRFTRTHALPRGARIVGFGKVTLIGTGREPMFAPAQSLSLANLVITTDPSALNVRQPLVVESVGHVSLQGVRTQNTGSAYRTRTFKAVDSAFVNNGVGDDASYGVLIDAEQIDLLRTQFIQNKQFLNGGGPPHTLPQSTPSRRLIVRDSEFTENRRGLLALGSTDVQISGSRFTKNGLVGEQGWDCCGGALTAAHSTISVRSSDFSGNRSGGAGGAILAVGSAIHISESLFTRNNAQLGGAIAAFGQSMIAGTWNQGAPSAGQLTLRLDRSRFHDNQSSSVGGAIAWTGGLQGQGALFVGNKAGTGGGALAIATLAKHEARQAVLGIGTLTAPLQDHPLSLSGGIFLRNVATQGAAIYADGASIQLGNALVSDNRSEGSAVVIAGVTRLVNSTLSGNQGFGVAVAGPSRKLSLDNTILSGNSMGACASQTSPIDAVASFQFPGQTCGSDVLTQDPKLNPNFSPSLTSPVRDAGSLHPCMSDPLVAGKDLRGTQRGTGGACDIGAVESETFLEEVRETLASAGYASIWLWLLLLLLVLLFLLSMYRGFRHARMRR